MKQVCPTAAIALALACLLPTPAAASGLDGFLAEVNVEARIDLGAFRVDLSTTFNVSSREVDELFEVFDSPADVYIALRIGDIARVSIERVVAEYGNHKGHGWGVIAKNLGIQPGSAEFHALKRGRLTARSRASSSDKPGKGNGGSKGKDKR